MRKGKLVQLIERAQSGDEQAMTALRKTSDLRLDFFVKEAGELAMKGEAALIDHIFQRNLIRKEGLKRKLALMREELAGPGATPLERLVAERVVASWLQVYSADWLFTNSLANPQLNPYFLNHLNQAHRRYESILRTSAQVQRLLKMVVQVNIGTQQVNVASP